MRKLLSSALVAGTVVTGAIGLSATSALAATWTVSNGGAFTATKSGTIQFKDTTSGQTFTCSASTIKGTAPNGTGLPGPGIATIGTPVSNFTGCSGPLGSTGTATLTAGSLNAVSYNATAPGTTSGTITGIAATLTISDLLGTCNATVTGAANTVKYSNAGTLTVTPDTASPALTIATASGSGCAGLIKAGDKATFQGLYSVSPVVKITSP